MPMVARQLQGYVKNVHSVLLPSMVGTEAIIAEAIATAVKQGVVQVGSPVVAVHGTVEAVTGSTNLLRVYTA